jgi:hypothetical protein
MLHPREALLQEARAFQRSPAFAPYRTLRQVAEHRLARLMQLGARQARYVGRTKTLFQLLLAATVANLTLAATAVGLLRGRRPRADARAAFLQAIHAAWIAICPLLAVGERSVRPLPHRAPAGFRPRF